MSRSRFHAVPHHSAREKPKPIQSFSSTSSSSSSIRSSKSSNPFLDDDDDDDGENDEVFGFDDEDESYDSGSSSTITEVDNSTQLLSESGSQGSHWHEIRVSKGVHSAQ